MNSCRKYNRRRRPYIYLFVAVVAYVVFRRLVEPEATGSPSVESRFLEKVFAVVNRFRPWHKLPTLLGVLNLISYRNVLHEKNLHNTSPATLKGLSNIACDSRSWYARRSDGTCNDLEHPEMGGAGQRFGRNVPREMTFPEKEPALLSPSPRLISQRLSARESFRPAQTLNLLAAAWIQFQTHDWFAHQRAAKLGEDDFKIPLDGNDEWPAGTPMHIPRTPPDPTRQTEESETPPTYINEESHWWDGSQIYGDDPKTTASLRDQGKLKIEGKDHLLPIDPHTKMPRTGFTQNWWIGLALLHTLFSREHNAIYDELLRANPYWSQDLDVASVDIMRDRERGVPRYNEFLRLVHKQPVKTFEEITSNQVWAQQLREVYGDVNRVDLMVGMFAEDLPEGFGFSDTAFRIFILMASRRLEGDRYFTTDFRPEIYTKEGLNWISNNDMRSVLLRHYPELRPALREVDNAFAPWSVLG